MPRQPEYSWRGTRPLFQALRMLRTRMGALGNGAEVIVPALHQPGTLADVVDAGFRPAIVDVDPTGGTLTAARTARAMRGEVVAIVAAHLWGAPADVAPLEMMALAHGVALLEDCRDGRTTTVNGRTVGSFGQLAILADQVVTPDSELAEDLAREKARPGWWWRPPATGSRDDAAATWDVLATAAAARGCWEVPQPPDTGDGMPAWTMLPLLVPDAERRARMLAPDAEGTRWAWPAWLWQDPIPADSYQYGTLRGAERVRTEGVVVPVFLPALLERLTALVEAWA